MRGTVFRLVLALAVLGLAACVVDTFRVGCGVATGMEIDSFLAGYWHDPLPPQGDVPAGTSSLEASLAPESCGVCHSDQYADWRRSRHANAMGPGLRWQLDVLGAADSRRCLRCHAPLEEQKVLTAREQGWSGAAPPAYAPADLHRRGLVCAACHVRRHQRFGPPPRARSSATPAHNGFTASAAFEDSRFCATCHQFTSEGRRLNGKPLENTYAEWRASPAARAGRSCQSCHMPGRRHTWRGIHDRETVEHALQRELIVTRLNGGRVRADATLRALDVGHDFPTYSVPKVRVSLRLRCADGTERELAHHTIGRSLDVDLLHEIADTRLPPGGEVRLGADVSLPPGPARVEFRVDVIPDEHYERVFRSWLHAKPRLDSRARKLLNEALLRIDAGRYRLNSLMVTVPSRPGDARSDMTRGQSDGSGLPVARRLGENVLPSTTPTCGSNGKAETWRK